jgi:hypothetical protein
LRLTGEEGIKDYSGGVQRRENEVKEVKGIKEVKEKTRLFAEMSKKPEEE